MPPPHIPSHVLYLHGFRSSPRSVKSQKLAAAIHALQQQGVAVHWCGPQLPPSPKQTVSELRELTRDWPDDSVVIGSSLGGFYAALMAQERGWRAAFINPAVQPARDLARHIGEQTAFHDPAERFFFRPEFIGEFEALSQSISPYPLKQPERHWALIAQGDEVLNWREMVAHHAGVPTKLLPGSDHAVSDFDDHLQDLMAWLGWST